MPYKQAVIPYLDSIDEHAQRIGAVNNVYFDDDGKLCGSNTDWNGVQGTLLELDPSGFGKCKPSLVIGAGGAIRAAVYTLISHFDVTTVYIVNRDVEEVEALKRDVAKYAADIVELLHVKEEAEVSSLPVPFYVIGTIPNVEPQTERETEVRNIVEAFLKKGNRDGALVDMCYQPRNTKLLQLGRKLEWNIADGTRVVGHQVEAQWCLWTKKDSGKQFPSEAAWIALEKAAEASPALNTSG